MIPNPANYSAISFPLLGIEVDPIRTISLGPLTIHLYGAVIALGLLLAGIYCSHRSKRAGLTEDDIITKKVYRKKVIRRVILGIAVFLALCPVGIFFAYDRLPSSQELIVKTSFLWEAISLISSVFLIVYLPILDILIDIERKRSTDTSSTSEENQGGEHKPISKIVVGAKATGMWLVALISLLMAIYCFGRYGASSQMEFDFIVDKYDYSFTYDGNVVYDNIILSETDELYYLSVCTISGSADNATITIYPNYHSIVKKGDEPINVIRKRFSTTHFVK